MNEETITVTLHVGHGGYKNGLMHRIGMGVGFIKFGIQIILGYQLTLNIYEVIPLKDDTK